MVLHYNSSHLHGYQILIVPRQETLEVRYAKTKGDDVVPSSRVQPLGAKIGCAAWQSLFLLPGNLEAKAKSGEPDLNFQVAASYPTSSSSHNMPHKPWLDLQPCPKFCIFCLDSRFQAVKLGVIFARS